MRTDILLDQHYLIGKSNMTPKEEIFGPVLSVIRVQNYEEALELVNNHQFGNGTSIHL